MAKHLLAAVAVSLFFTTPLLAQETRSLQIEQTTPTIGVVKAPKNHSTLVNVLNAAGVQATLNGSSDYTVFAPTNSAFAKLPKGTLQTLLQPENRDELKTLMSYHVVRGTLTTADLKRAVAEGNGAANLRTLEGDDLILRQSGNRLTVTDTSGQVSAVSASTSQLGNNVVYSVDRILKPIN